MKIRPLGPKMEKPLNQIAIETTTGQTKKLKISKIDLDYAYGQKAISEKRGRHRVFARTGGKSSVDYHFKKVSRSSPYPNNLLSKDRQNIRIMLTCMSQLEL